MGFPHLDVEYRREINKLGELEAFYNELKEDTQYKLPCLRKVVENKDIVQRIIREFEDACSEFASMETGYSLHVNSEYYDESGDEKDKIELIKKGILIRKRKKRYPLKMEFYMFTRPNQFRSERVGLQLVHLTSVRDEEKIFSETYEGEGRYQKIDFGKVIFGYWDYKKMKENIANMLKQK